MINLTLKVYPQRRESKAGAAKRRRGTGRRFRNEDRDRNLSTRLRGPVSRPSLVGRRLEMTKEDGSEKKTIKWSTPSTVMKNV